ncbi:uncharacterized protein MELLADRAFT_90044 [Melampsora larici-populina 98AG31]|uniref:histone deacetylase n=1 Tax=Melampsora larici-populina (strain 98AG31 / pathotype 3-4-7) TaxID=747676 RepID=F4RVI7_MELLP|nr:uncharacterized protein MELLADRAFT_90044 [Melampsora larici-populina 98AG31]EGG03660.1 hypothetical protein MELLADRAFT_90044 [Melampsora larici-populina 98AG31]
MPSSQLVRSHSSTLNGPSSSKTGLNQPPSTASQSSHQVIRSSLSSIPTGICSSEQMLKHWKPDCHFDHEDDDDDDDDEPERPSRITRIMAQVTKAKLIPHLLHVQVRKATKEEIMLVHSEGHWNRIQDTASMDIQELKDRATYYSRLSLFVNAETFDCARLSCGGVIEMCRAVVEGRIRNGFAVVRPPGHHSEPEDPSGFCVFNNAAVTAKWLRTIYPDKIRRILLIDWDVHHGNGTQRSFYHDPSVLYISIHRYLENGRTTYFYPGSDWGGSTRIGEGLGRGYNVNIPWPEAGMGDEDYIFAFQRLVMPIAMEFNPDFVIVSAGFDAAKNDPLGECNVTPAGFALMTHMLSSLANGNIVLALEGGYHLESLALSATECIKVLMGETPPKLEKALVASDVATETVDECLRVQAEFWKSLPRGLLTQDELTMERLNIPISDVLGMHRSYDLHHTHNLCAIPLHDTTSTALTNNYTNKIMVSSNVYETETVVLFMHDLGNVRNELHVQPTNFNDEKAAMLEGNTRIMKWLHQHEYGIIDVQVSPPTSDLTTDGLAKKVERKKAVKELVNWLWSQFLTLADCENLVLICLGEGCKSLPPLLSIKGIQEKLKASVYVPTLNRIPPPKLSPDLDWYQHLSITFYPQGPLKDHGLPIPTDISSHGLKLSTGNSYET